MKRVAAALIVFALLGPAAAVQPQRGVKAPGGHSGFGVSIDLGSVLRGAVGLIADRSEYADDELVLAWQPGESAIDPQALAREFEATVRARTLLANLGLEVAVLVVPSERRESVLSALRDRPGLVVDRHALVQPLGSEGRLYAAELIGAGSSQALARPVRIGLVDGVLPADLPLAATVHSRNFADGQTDGGEHAAAVACLIACRAAGRFFGLLQGAELYGAAVLRQNGHTVRGDTFALVRALDWLIGERCELINISLGGPGDAVLALAIRHALARRALIVAAGGNGGANAKPVYPAAYPGVIAVAAVDAQAQPWPQGNRGDYITIAAPGVDVWVPVGGGRYLSGTSYAAPFVSAALAARIAAGQSASAAALCAEARDLPPAGHDERTGCGLLRWPEIVAASMGCAAECGSPLKKNVDRNDSREGGRINTTASPEHVH